MSKYSTWALAGLTCIGGTVAYGQTSAHMESCGPHGLRTGPGRMIISIMCGSELIQPIQARERDDGMVIAEWVKGNVLVDKTLPLTRTRVHLTQEYITRDVAGKEFKIPLILATTESPDEKIEQLMVGMDDSKYLIFATGS